MRTGKVRLRHQPLPLLPEPAFGIILAREKPAIANPLGILACFSRLFFAPAFRRWGGSIILSSQARFSAASRPASAVNPPQVSRAEAGREAVLKRARTRSCSQTPLLKQGAKKSWLKPANTTRAWANLLLDLAHLPRALTFAILGWLNSLRALACMFLAMLYCPLSLGFVRR